MRWSKLRKSVEECLADEVKPIVTIHMTSYRNHDGYSRSWIEINKKEVVSFSDVDALDYRGSTYHELTIELFSTLDSKILKYAGNGIKTNPDIPCSERSPGVLAELGEFSSSDFTKACFEHVTASRSKSITSRHPLLRALAVIDRKVGLKKVEAAVNDIHPLVAYLANARLQASKCSA
jgi:hypothetical protein